MGEVDDRVKETDDEQEEQRKKVSEFFKQVAGDDGEVRILALIYEIAYRNGSLGKC